MGPQPVRGTGVSTLSVNAAVQATITGKLIGREASGARYLVASEEFEIGEMPPADAQARILDTEQSVLFEPLQFHSITARLPRLEEYTGAEGELKALLADVEVRGPPVSDTPYREDFDVLNHAETTFVPLSER